MAVVLAVAQAGATAQPPRDEPGSLPREGETAPAQAAPELAAPRGPYAPDVAEEGSVEAIREATTAPEFLPESVAYVPESETVPSPADFLGHIAGAPGELTRAGTVHAYFRRLAGASPRVEVETIGVSEEGREILLARISSEDNLTAADALRAIRAELADPRETPREEARRLAAAGRPAYYLIGGLHSPETGSPEMLMELAYRLAVSERPEIASVRDRLVVMITPVAEPDGRDRMVDWYYRHLKGRDLPWEELRPLRSPPYWGRYVYHDNNRDGLQLTQALTRAVTGAFYRHLPQVVHDLHESLPLLYISTGHGPYSRAVDPVTINRWTELAHHEAGGLQAQGLPGVWVWGFWDGWWPGYLVSVANNHHAVGRFYETFGNVSAETFERDLSETRYVGERVTEVEWYRPWPPEETVTWSLRNNTNYMQAGVLEALGWAARHAEDLLFDQWVKAERTLERARREPPHAWVFPEEQRDAARLARLVELLGEHRIEVHRLTEEAELGETVHPAGSWVVRLDQPYGNAARTFLEVQEFPADEPNPPYDDVAWTFPLLLGVEATAIDDPGVLEAAMEPHHGPVRVAGGVVEDAPAWPVAAEPAGEETEEGDEMAVDLLAGTTPPPPDRPDEVFLLADTGQTSLLAARFRLADYQVDAAEEPFEAGGRSYPRGSWLVFAPRSVVDRVGRELGLVLRPAARVPRVPRHVLDLPRLGVLHTWTSTQDAGWTRYTLDRDGVPYRLLSPDDVREGALDEVDVVLFPHSRGDFKRIVHGIDPALGPLAYTRTEEYPSHGTPNASDDITGGMGFEGLLALERFLARGGVLLALGNSGTLPVDGGLVRGVDRLRGSFNTPGSELSARVTAPAHPIGYGYEEVTSVFRGNGPLWEVPERLRDRIVLAYGAGVPEWREEDAEDAPGEGAAEASEREASDVDASPSSGPLFEEEELDLGAVPAPDEDAEPGEETEAPRDFGLELDPTGEEPAEPATSTAEPIREEDPAERPLVLSGFVSGVEEVTGAPAVLDLPVGRGRVVLYAFDPLHRYLNLSDFRFVWNAILHWNDLPAAPREAGTTRRGAR